MKCGVNHLNVLPRQNLQRQFQCSDHQVNLSSTCLTAAMLQEQQLSSVVLEVLEVEVEQQGGQQHREQTARQTELLLWKTYIGQP